MLNKKALRTFADTNPAPAIPAGHGLLHAQQVDYIIRTDVRIVDHHRTLILYIYDRERAADGDPRPLWTMFHAGEDYITLVRRPDGTTSWRTAAFERLGKDYRFISKCAFYSAGDRERMVKYFKNDAPDFSPLIRAQDKILARRQKKRERQRDKVIRARMDGLPALPRNLVTWAHLNIMPAYFIYGHAKHGKATGVCSSCAREAVLTDVRHNAEATCPHCGRELIMKPRGRIGRLYDRETFQVVQRAGTGLVVRIMKAACAYSGEHPGTVVYESARQFVYLDEGGGVHCDCYYFAHGESRWKRGERPVAYPYQYNFEPDTRGHVYCNNLPKALRGTPWEYCPIALFYSYDHEPMRMYPFLAAHIAHPRLELLIKVGFHRLAFDLAYGRIRDGLLDETQNRTHRLLRVMAEDVDFLRELDVDAETLRAFREYEGVRDRQQLLRWQLEHEVRYNVAQCLEHTTAHKLMRYLDGQHSALCEKTEPGWPRHRDMQSVVTEYRDYLDMCVRLGYDMTNSFVLFPRDLKAAHDRVQRRLKVQTSVQLREDFAAAMRSISRHLDFEMNGMRIVMPSSPDEIVAEGHALHHCVGTYINRVANHESLILFLRRCEDVDKPFFTIEVKNRKAVQVRGMQNADMTPEVRRFISRWERQVLQRQDLEAAA